MANKKISQLPAASSPLAGTEIVPLVQGGTTDRTTAQDIANLAVISIGAGTNITVDNTDPHNPIVSAAGGGGLFAGRCYVTSGGSIIESHGVASVSRVGSGSYFVTVDPSFFAGFSVPDLHFFVSTMGVGVGGIYAECFYNGSDVFTVNLFVQTTNAPIDAVFGLLIVPMAS